MVSTLMNRKFQTPMKKMFISYLFDALIIFALLYAMSTVVYAEVSGDFEYQFFSPTNVEITGYTGSAPDVVIPSTLDGYAVTRIGDQAFYNLWSLTSIDIPDSVTSIGIASFAGCSSLRSIELPNGITSIASQMFSGCSSLTSIDLPESLTSIGFRAFTSSGLTSIQLPTSVVSIGDYAFRGCSNLASIEFPDGLVSIGHYAFSSCSSLISVDIPNNITSIGLRVFEYGSSLSSVNLPDKLTGIGCGWFMKCTSLTNINVPDSVTYIGKAGFAGCSSLTDIDLPDSLTRIGSLAFSGCTSLTNIDIPESVTYIYDFAFSNCSNLISARFFGNAPTLSMPFAFDGTHADFKVYYLFGTTGYTNPWYGYPTEVFYLGSPPTVTDSSKTGLEYTPLSFTLEDFTSNFNDVDGESLTKIKIEALPANGTLMINSTAVQSGDEIFASEINNMTFMPDGVWDGITSFKWFGHDSSRYSVEPAVVTITISEMTTKVKADYIAKFISSASASGDLKGVSNPNQFKAFLSTFKKAAEFLSQMILDLIEMYE